MSPPTSSTSAATRRNGGDAQRPRMNEDVMSDKQIAASVRFGRKITFWVLDQPEVIGYVAGLDRFNYFVLVPNYERSEANDDQILVKYLIHKGSVPLIELHDSSSLDAEEEPFKSELRKIIVPFRTKVLEEFYPDLPRRNDATPRAYSTD